MSCWRDCSVLCATVHCVLSKALGPILAQESLSMKRVGPSWVKFGMSLTSRIPLWTRHKHLCFKKEKNGYWKGIAFICIMVYTESCRKLCNLFTESDRWPLLVLVIPCMMVWPTAPGKAPLTGHTSPSTPPWAFYIPLEKMNISFLSCLFTIHFQKQLIIHGA